MEIKRDRYLKQLIESRQNGFVKMATGIRRCSKSYLPNVLFYRYLLDNGKQRLKDTEEHTMLLFSLAGMPVENVEKVCDIVKLFVETEQTSANKDLCIPLNKKLRNAELKQFVTNIKGIIKKKILMQSHSFKPHLENGSVAKRNISQRITPYCLRILLFQRMGWKRI